MKSIQASERGGERQGRLKLIARDRYLLAMLVPAVAFIFIFRYVPMYGIVLSFKKFDYAHPLTGGEWVGLRYFFEFFQSYDSWLIIRNTLLLNLYALLFGFPAPIALALLFNELRAQRFKKTVQTISYLPNFISTVVICGMIKLILSPSSGWVNKLIVLLGGTTVDFMIKAEWFRAIYVASGIWQGVGWGSIVYLAAISSIDIQLYEAAIIDGAGRWRQMLHITIPSIRDTIVILLIFQMGSMLASGTEKVLLLYNPLTYETGDVLGTYLYRVGLLGGNYNLGTAIGFFNSVVSLVLIWLTNFAAKKYSDIGIW